jgi:hypothetical protein
MTVDYVDRVSAEARNAPVRPLRAALVAVGAVFYGIGWVGRAGLFAASWAFAAIRLGWADAAGRFDGPKKR